MHALALDADCRSRLREPCARPRGVSELLGIYRSVWRAQNELRDVANDLARTATAAWRVPASFAIGLAGAAWSYISGDPVTAVLGAAGALVGLSDSAKTKEAGAYSYLFAARSRFG